MRHPGLLVLLLVAIPGQAQDAPAPERTTLRGSVVDAKGEPWSNLPVVLVAHPWEEAATIDRIQVRSDARGRFRARLLPGLTYQAWALTNPDSEGRYRSTQIASCRGGEKVTLQELEEHSLLVRVRLPTMEGLAPENLRVLVRATRQIGPPVELRPDADREVRVPPLPGGACRVRVLDQNRVLRVAEHHFTLLEWKRGGRTDEEVLELRPSLPMLIRVTSGGKPLAGARVVQAVGSDAIVALSDAEGWVVYRHPSREFRRNSWQVLQILIEADGHASTWVSRIFQVREKGKGETPPGFPDGIIIEADRKIDEMRSRGKADFEVPLAKAERLEGRLLLGEGRPAAGLPLRVRTRQPPATGPGIRLTNARGLLLATVTDAQGRFVVDGLAPDQPYVIHALVPPTTAAAIGQPRLHPVAWIAEGSTKENMPPLDNVVLATLPATTLTIRLEDGGPGRFANALVAGEYLDLTMGLTCDRLGRSTTLLPRRGRYVVAAACNGRGLQLRTTLSPDQENVLVLWAPVWISGRVVSGNGTGLPGATVRLRYRGSKEHTLLADLLSLSSGVTDERGFFRIAARRDSSGSASARWRDGSWYRSRSVQFQLGEDPCELDFTIPDAPDPEPAKKTEKK